MRTSLSPAAAAIQPWMGGGKSAQKPPRRRRTTPSIKPKQPGSASLSDSSLKQPTGAQRASGRASLSGEQARRARSKRLPGPGRARGVASPQHPPSFWPPPPPRSSPAGGHAPFTIAPRRRRADRRPYRRAGLPGATAWCSAPSQPRIGSHTHSEALQWHPSPTCACTECRTPLGRARAVVDEHHRGGPPRTAGATGDHAQAPHGQRQPTGSHRERPRTTGAKPLPGAPCTGRRHEPVTALQGAAADSRNILRVGYSPPLGRR